MPNVTNIGQPAVVTKRDHQATIVQFRSRVNVGTFPQRHVAGIEEHLLAATGFVSRGSRLKQQQIGSGDPLDTGDCDTGER